MVAWDGALYVVGGFNSAGGIPTNCVARWNAVTGWTTLRGGVNTNGMYPSHVAALGLYTPAIGPMVGETVMCVGGLFSSVSTIGGVNFAGWDGQVWRDHGYGVHGTIRAMTSCQPPDGPRVFLAGEIDVAGGFFHRNLAVWDEATNTWESLGDPVVSGLGSSLEVLNTDSESSTCGVYLGGRFAEIDNNRSPGIAQFDGTSWLALGTGLGATAGTESVVDIEFFDDGTGRALYAAGSFTVSGGDVTGEGGRMAAGRGQARLSVQLTRR